MSHCLPDTALTTQIGEPHHAGSRPPLGGRIPGSPRDCRGPLNGDGAAFLIDELQAEFCRRRHLGNAASRPG
jgi:hypothetical protein